MVQFPHTHTHMCTHVHTCKLKVKFHSSQESASRVHSCMGRDGRPGMLNSRATFYMGCRCWIEPLKEPGVHIVGEPSRRRQSKGPTTVLAGPSEKISLRSVAVCHNILDGAKQSNLLSAYYHLGTALSPPQMKTHLTLTMAPFYR